MENPYALSVEEYVKLVDCIRTSTNKRVADISFDRIVKALNPRIKSMCRKFNIPGFEDRDIYQEALMALRYKAINSYDKTKGSGEGLAHFDRFAMMCIRRHLSTEWKTSQQVKNQAMIRSVSLTQDRNDGDEDLSLINIIPNGKGDVLHGVERREYLSRLVSRLLGKLSKFEQEVFVLYMEKYSYEKISEIINRRRGTSRRVNIKGVDNALSRIKSKAENVYDKHGEKDIRVRDATKQKQHRKKGKKSKPNEDRHLDDPQK